jgi:hypothetical protein
VAGCLPWIEAAQNSWRTGGKKGIYQLLFFIASSGAGRLRLNLKPEPGDILLCDADGKIGSYSYFAVFAALAHLIFPSSQENFGPSRSTDAYVAY